MIKMSSSTSRLQGKNVLIIGCSSGPKSMEILRTCRMTGAILFVATCPKHYERMLALLQQEETLIQQGIYFLIVPLMNRPIECARELVVAEIVQAALNIPTIFPTTQPYYSGLDACVTFQEVFVDYAPCIQKALNLPGFDPAGVDIACHKLHFRQTLQQAGTFGVIHACSLKDYLIDPPNPNVSTKLLNTTVVLKPTFGSGTLIFYGSVHIHLISITLDFLSILRLLRIDT